MRLCTIVGALAVAIAAQLAATGANATGLFATHTCYYNRPARPVLETATRLVIMAPGYWENALLPSAYARTEDSDRLYHRRGGRGGRHARPLADRLQPIWHEPIYAPITEQIVVDPGRELLARAQGCRSHW